MKKVILSWTHTYLFKTITDFEIIDVSRENAEELVNRVYELTQGSVLREAIEQEVNKIIEGDISLRTLPDHHTIRAERVAARVLHNTIGMKDESFVIVSFRLIPIEGDEVQVNFHCLVDNHVLSNVKHRNDLEPISYVFDASSSEISIKTASGFYRVTGYEIQKLKRDSGPLSVTSYETFINGNRLARTEECKYKFMDNAAFQFSSEFKAANSHIAEETLNASYYVKSNSNFLSINGKPMLELVRVDETNIARKNIITNREEIVANMIRVY